MQFAAGGTPIGGKISQFLLEKVSSLVFCLCSRAVGSLPLAPKTMLLEKHDPSMFRSLQRTV